MSPDHITAIAGLVATLAAAIPRIIRALRK